MLLIISLIIVALFIYFLKGSLKKHAGILYRGGGNLYCSISDWISANAFILKE